MAIHIKTASEVEYMRRSGRIVAEVLDELRAAVRPGITTAALDALTVSALEARGARSSTLGYTPGGFRYPASLCTSVNGEVVHSIPGSRILVAGDIITLDLAASYNGWHADAAITVPVDTISAETRRLLQVAETALFCGIAAARAGNRLQDIGRSVQRSVETQGCFILRSYAGHGIGRSMHEEPAGVLNYVQLGYDNPALEPGMVITIEPVITLKAVETRVLDDHWTVVTEDGSYAAHFEHTIAITEGDAEILTRL